MKRFPQTILLAVLALAGPAASLRGQEPADRCYRSLLRNELSSNSHNSNTANRAKSSTPWAGCSAFRRRSFFGTGVRSIIMCLLETEQNLAQYLEANGLTSTKVRINQYDPIGEWRRLRANKEVGAGWRYTVGAFGTVIYTVLPGRVFGPTNTIHTQIASTSIPISLASPRNKRATQKSSTLVLTRAPMPHSPRYRSCGYGLRRSRRMMCSTTHSRTARREQQEEATRSSTRNSAPKSAARLPSSWEAIFRSRWPAQESAMLQLVTTEMTEPELPAPEADGELTASQSNEVGPSTLKR